MTVITLPAMAALGWWLSTNPFKRTTADTVLLVTFLHAMQQDFLPGKPVSAVFDPKDGPKTDVRAITEGRAFYAALRLHYGTLHVWQSNSTKPTPGGHLPGTTKETP